MAIQFDTHEADAEPGVMVEMNITPLIDVMLVLLVMLIITIPIQLHSINVEMPAGPPPTEITEPLVVKIDILRTNQVVWNGELLPDLRALEARLQTAAQQKEPPEVHVQPEPTARYDTVAGVLGASQRAGLRKVGVVGLEQFAK